MVSYDISLEFDSQEKAESFFKALQKLGTIQKGCVVSEKTFTEKQLVDFGNYLLSGEREQRYSELSTDALEERLSMVSDADVANFQTLLNKDQGVQVSDTTEADSSNADHQIKISELREKFFKECAGVIEENSGAANAIFEWFKPYLKIPSIDWEGFKSDFIDACKRFHYHQLFNWLKTKLQDYIK